MTARELAALFFAWLLIPLVFFNETKRDCAGYVYEVASVVATTSTSTNPPHTHAYTVSSAQDVCVGIRPSDIQGIRKAIMRLRR